MVEQPPAWVVHTRNCPISVLSHGVPCPVIGAGDPPACSCVSDGCQLPECTTTAMEGKLHIHVQSIDTKTNIEPQGKNL